VLDGGHILMALIEKIRRRPLNVRLVEYATTAFAFALISFMLYVTFFDIKRMPLIGSWFKSKTTIEQAEPAPR
jgi:regulator of sigma E protease